MIFALLFCFVGCGESDQILPGSSGLGAYSDHTKPTQETALKRNYISMIYYADMDENPLTTTVPENHELLKLVYSPLLRVTGRLKPQYVLAESIVTEGKKVTVTLKAGLKFSDGSKVTAEDVDDSIQTIRKNPNSPYNSRFTNIKRYYAEDNRTLVIYLKEADVDFINNLDFPVMKQGKGVGCGPYKFGKKGGEAVLVANELYLETPSIQTIYLKSPANQEERQNMFSVGLLDAYFGTAESKQVFAAGKNYNVQIYPGDNLLYLGINCREGLLAKADFRGFLNLALAREKLVQSVLLGQAEAARYPYQPSWYKSPQTVEGSGLGDAERKAAIETLGLKLEENVLQDAKGKAITFNLLVCKENEVHKDAAAVIAEGFAMIGITLKIQAVSRADYDTRLAEGKFDLYLGEVKTGRTLNSSLYAEGSAINFSGKTFPALQGVAADYKSGKKTLSEFAQVFDQYTPIIPLAYRGGAIFAAADIDEFQSTGSWALYGDGAKLKTKETEKTS
jgi:ABC-type transport system substrate-binding protein